MVDKPVIYRSIVQQAQVDGGQSLDTERHHVVLDTRAQLIRVVVWQEGTRLVPAATDLADQRQIVGKWGKCLPDKLIDHCGSVVVGRIDVIDPGVDGRTQHGDGLIVVPGRAEYSGAGQPHRAVADPPYHLVGQVVSITRCIHDRHPL